MGSRGPVPKRSSERRRRNADSVESVDADGVVVMPEPSEGWHPVAAGWYESLVDSGQSQFFEPSDWAAAFYVAEAMSLNLEAKRFSAQLFASVWSAMSDLLSTEGSRRRARLEIERVVGGDAEVTSLDDFRSQLAKG